MRIETILDSMKCDDGIVVERSVEPNNGSPVMADVLSIVQRYNRVMSVLPEGRAVVSELYEPTDEQLGDQDRLQLLLEAVCRYFTTGGNWEQLSRALTVVKTVVPGSLDFGDYKLIESSLLSDGTCYHVFSSGDYFYRWFEGATLTRLTADEYFAEIDDGDTSEADVFDIEDFEEEEQTQEALGDISK